MNSGIPERSSLAPAETQHPFQPRRVPLAFLAFLHVAASSSERSPARELPGGDRTFAGGTEFRSCKALVGQIEEPHLSSLCSDRLAALLAGARRIAGRA